jgi:hypothetical protein
MATVLEELFIAIKTTGTNTARKSIKGMGKAIKAVVGDIKIFKANLAAIAVSGAFRSIGNQIRNVTTEFKELVQSSIDLAAQQQDAEIGLTAAMKTAGDFSKEAIDDLKNFAGAMQDISTHGDELVLNQLAIAKAFGASNEQAKEIVEASIELAAATKVDLNSAVRQVSKTLGGFAGELSETQAGIKALTSEELKAGKAAKILLASYGGQAQKGLKSFTAQSAQLANIWGDMKENIGGPLLDVILPAIKELKTDLKAMAPSFTRFGQALAKTFTVVKRIFEAFGGNDLLKSGIEKFGQFILDMALLVEDLFFYMKGERSFIGTQLDAKGFDSIFEGLSVKLGEKLGPAIISALVGIGNFLIGVFKGLGSVIFEELKTFIPFLGKLLFDTIIGDPVKTVAGAFIPDFSGAAASIGDFFSGGPDSKPVTNTNNNQKSTIINQTNHISTTEAIKILKQEIEMAAQEVQPANGTF